MLFNLKVLVLEHFFFFFDYGKDIVLYHWEENNTQNLKKSEEFQFFPLEEFSISLPSTLTSLHSGWTYQERVFWKFFKGMMQLLELQYFEKFLTYGIFTFLVDVIFFFRLNLRLLKSLKYSCYFWNIFIAVLLLYFFFYKKM